MEHHMDPLIVCYHAKTIKRAAAYIKSRKNVILGVDRTFDVSKYFLTTLTLSFDNFVDPENGTSPTMSLAYLLHTKATAKYYVRFFQKIKEALEDASLALDENPTLNFQTTGPEFDLYEGTEEMNVAKYSIGSDQERAILKAAKLVFPSSKHILCTLHLKKNALSNFAIKARTTAAERYQLMHDIYDMKRGLIASKTEESFDLQLNTILEEYAERDDVVKYLKLATNEVKEFAVVPFLYQNRQQAWTNNGCESVNCILKKMTN